MKNSFYRTVFALLAFSFGALSLQAQTIDTIPNDIFGALKFRNISPSFISGRIADLAVNPNNHSEYYVAVASGGIWKTTNNGTTFKPVFDNYSSYSVGCLTMDPNNTNIIWAGTGENNHQRSVSYGDGVYKSVDGGKSWKNMGLKKSFHIGRIVVHPDNSDVVFVAAEGSVWGPGGDRGLFKTEDGGKTWKKILEISENTGVNNVVMDPVDHNIVYATSEQRRRRTQTRIGGGPESGFWKSTDGGETWNKLTNGLPKADKGGVSIEVSPIDHNTVYAMVESTKGNGGFFKSNDRGESWKKMSDYNTSGQYYGEFFLSPFDINTIYSMETRSKVSRDGGKTWKNIGNNARHVDDHAFWLDPDDENHFMIGGDGGLYETFDNGSTYNHKMIPVTQYYRVRVDDTKPFYWIYGGTQDNSSMGGLSNTLYSDGISRAEWDITLGGDGFWQAVEPGNTNIVYSEYQYGNIYRYDKNTGEKICVKPREEDGDLLYKWNWNAPFILSAHNKKKLYIAANYLFMSEDRGNSWTKISDDITSGMDRDGWKVMGRYWSVDGVAKDVSTSLYGTAVSLAESPIKQGLVYVGTDDGVLSVTGDDGKTWNKIQSFPGVPAYTYISDIEPSQFDANTVYVTFDNRKHFDFTPYVLKSTDMGKTWINISGDLPKELPIHSIKQDFVSKDLLFVGTEFGVYYTSNGGKQWLQLKSGIPTISVRDIDIHEGEEDLVLATFGRGFYVLDDYSALREITPEFVNKEFYMFPIKDANLYVPRNRGGYGFGSVEYRDKNEPFGATFTYYVKEVPKTLKQQREEKEKELIKSNAKIPKPSIAELRREDEEVAPYLFFEIRDDKGMVVRKLKKSISKGINRITWDLRLPTPVPIDKHTYKFDPLKKESTAMLASEGEYSVDVYRYVRGMIDTLAKAQKFRLVPLNMSTLPFENKEELVKFNREVLEIYRKAMAARKENKLLLERCVNLKYLSNNTPGVNAELMAKVDKVESDLRDIAWQFTGQIPPASMEERRPQPVPLNDRLDYLYHTHLNTRAKITKTELDAIDMLKKRLEPIINDISDIRDVRIKEIEKEFDKLGAGWTPGRKID